MSERPLPPAVAGGSLPSRRDPGTGHGRSLRVCVCERKTERAAPTESPVWTKPWRLEGVWGLLPKLLPPCHGAFSIFSKTSVTTSQTSSPSCRSGLKDQIPGFFRCPSPPLRTGRGARRDCSLGPVACLLSSRLYPAAQGGSAGHLRWPRPLTVATSLGE